MPRHFRVCKLCPNTSMQLDLAFFRASNLIIKTLKLNSETDAYICENHFNPEDIKIRGCIKTLQKGVLPKECFKGDGENCSEGAVSLDEIGDHQRESLLRDKWGAVPLDLVRILKSKHLL